MGLIAKQGGGDFQIPNAGQYAAICHQVIDLGHQFNAVHNKWQPKVRIGWELHGENMIGEGVGNMEDGRPFTVSSEFTVSLADNGHLRPMLEGWRGRPFSEEELEGFDISKLLGVPCMLTIQHTNSNGKTYANVTAATPLLKALPRPQQVNDSLLFNFEPWNGAEFEALPQWVRDKIKKSREFSEGTNTKPTNGEQGGQQQAPFNDDIPF